MDLAEFDYTLPDELIAQTPLAERAASRMLVVDRARGCWEDRQFRDLPAFLHAGDCLVLNDSRVFPARLFGHRVGRAGHVEVLLLRPVDGAAREWEALVHPGKKMRVGERVLFAERLEAEVIARRGFGERTLRFAGEGDVYEEFEKIGHVPLPPYIRRQDEAADRERYQTVFAREKGSAAAPTAGLHFTPQVLDACRASGADIAFVTLHVGLGTFQPIHADRIEGYRLHTERYRITADNAARMTASRRLVAVGTTCVRTIESAIESAMDIATPGGGLRESSGETDIFIYPPFEFRATGAMLTNFHLPRTSLLLLVCAFAGKDLALAAYRHAVEQRYRFYSYGDCMLIV
ncbi:MAG TPA: tRNA preQ1(34) S-adenosylmethionine ribosyltransferase-isomerase QueA [Bryobacteraceae bacterium]|jgi:S-adenosylmethionine:tRNA ribosyltransferase-isomerase|nr:tRNA preQ1(34) S-adenosylmethionine ribosyltransferase-isomerase QueA [Bryobacteraceae bacterium]